MTPHKKEKKLEEKIAIVGYPNCGKTTIFNFLAKKVERVGNWDGVTVNANFGIIDKKSDTIKHTIIDLPGIKSFDHYLQQVSCNAPCYSKKQCMMCPVSVGKDTTNNKHYIQELCQKDELESFDFLLSNDITCILNVIDATKLHRDLKLTVQLIELGLPVIVAINKIDLAFTKNLKINFKLLEKKLHCKVLFLNAKKKNYLLSLKQELIHIIKQGLPTYQNSMYPKQIDIINKKIRVKTHNKLTLLKTILINTTQKIQKNLQNNTSNNRVYDLSEVSNILHLTYKENNINNSSMMNDNVVIALNNKAYQIYKTSVVEHPNIETKHNISKILDNIFLNKWLSIPILAVILQLIFYITIGVGGYLQELLSDVMQLTIDLYIKPSYEYLFSNQLPIMITVIDGIISGIKVLVSFIPIIWVLYFLLSVFEDSGYMMRATTRLDRLLRRIGISGKTIIPLILSFGCNVPAILSTRTIRTMKHRIIAVFMIPFIICSARLTVFTVFCGIFFPQDRIYVIMVVYLCSCIVSLGAGYVLHYSLYNNVRDLSLIHNKDHPHDIELPDYNIPNFRYVLGAATYKVKEFARNIWSVILVISVVINMFSVIIKNSIYQKDTNTIITNVSSYISPALKYIGITNNNWQATAALISGIFAKEIVIITLTNLYNLESEKTSSQEQYQLTQNTELQNWQRIMKSHFKNDVNVMSYLLFILFYFPCIAVFAAIKNEVGCKYAILSGIFQTICAYSCSAIFYKLSIITHVFDMNYAMLLNIILSVVILLLVFKAIALIIDKSRIMKVRHKFSSKFL